MNIESKTRAFKLIKTIVSGDGEFFPSELAQEFISVVDASLPVFQVDSRFVNTREMSRGWLDTGQILSYEDVYDHEELLRAVDTIPAFRLIHFNKAATAISAQIYMISGEFDVSGSSSKKDKPELMPCYSLEYMLGHNMPIILKAAFEEVSYGSYPVFDGGVRRLKFRPYKLPDFAEGSFELSDFD